MMRGGGYAGGVIVVRDGCWRHHWGATVFCAGGIVNVQQRLVGWSGAINSGDFNVKEGQVPLFVYYRVCGVV